MVTFITMSVSHAINYARISYKVQIFFRSRVQELHICIPAPSTEEVPVASFPTANPRDLRFNDFSTFPADTFSGLTSLLEL